MLTNYSDVPEDVTAIPHTYRLMVEQAERAARLNRAPAMALT
jgi:hypothetical protein